MVAIVNGHRIAKSSNDPSDAEALTPNQFLLLRPGSKLPPSVFTKEDSITRAEDGALQLQERQKWAYPSRNVSDRSVF